MAARIGILSWFLAFGAIGLSATGTFAADDPKPANPARSPAMPASPAATPGRIWFGLSFHKDGAHVSLGGEGTPWRPFYFRWPLDGVLTVDFKISRPVSFPSGDEAPAEPVVPVGPK